MVTVEAAGAVVYRQTADGSLEVCLVHRPKYDDWSLPKGKLEPRESHAHAAVREIHEETGLPIRLSAPLAETRYALHLDGSEGSRSKSRKAGRHGKKQTKTKHVVYWVGEILNSTQERHRRDAFGARIEQDKEADEVRWLRLDEAVEKLSYDTDKQVAETFPQVMPPQRHGAVATVMIVRHGKAEPRKHWTGTDDLRPLTPNGAAAAFALSRELACFAPSVLLTSPWARCAQTLTPYAVSSQQELTMAEELTEETVANSPQHSINFVLDALREAVHTPQKPLVICTHRPVFEKLFPALIPLCATDELAAKIPTQSPYLQTACGLALSVTHSENGISIVDLQEVKPRVY